MITDFFQALHNNFTITNFTFYHNDKILSNCPGGHLEEYHSKKKHLSNESWAKDILEKTSEFTRIYVFFGTKKCLRYFMGQMRETGLFSDSAIEKDPYLVVYVETNVENPSLSDQDLFLILILNCCLKICINSKHYYNL